MRRVAAEIGAGTMTLYHYVRTKDDLVDLMDDAIMGEVLIPDGELRGDWREAMRAIARRSHDGVPAAPVGAAGDVGLARRAERHAALRAVAGRGRLARHRRARSKLELIAIVDDYVFGYVFRTGEVAAAFKEMATEEVIAELMPYFEAQLATGEYPEIENLFGLADARLTWERIVETMTDAPRFETGLDLLLDGIEAKLTRDGAI